MKKTISAALAGALLLGLAGGCSKSASGGAAVTVEAVSAIVGGGSVGLADWYAGMVVSGETADVKRDSNKTVLKTYVEEGDMVRAGDPLFCYDSEKMQLDLDMLYLDKENYANTIEAAELEVEELTAERDKAKEEDKLDYTLQIDSRKADIREAEYNSSVNDRKIASMEASLENAEVVSPIAGRVMTINEDGTSDYDYYDPGSADASAGVDYITVTDVTSMRIQGNINEMNAGALMEGMPMTIRSRTDAEQTWSGTLSMIDWENPVKNTDDESMVYVSSSSGDDGMTTTNKYPFYIELEDTEGLLLGQHVYIEPDTGEDEGDAPAGPMLPGYYLAYEEDGSAYVWADNGGKLEKRAVTLGAHDEFTDAYEITEGLDLTDYIAFPAEDLTEGQATEVFDPSAAAAESGEAGAEGSGTVEAVGF